MTGPLRLPFRSIQSACRGHSRPSESGGRLREDDSSLLQNHALDSIVIASGSLLDDKALHQSDDDRNERPREDKVGFPHPH